MQYLFLCFLSVIDITSCYVPLVDLDYFDFQRFVYNPPLQKTALLTYTNNEFSYSAMASVGQTIGEWYMHPKTFVNVLLWAS